MESISHRLKITAIIMAGGKSSRMGQDKAFLKIGALTIVEYQLRRLSPLFDEILISTNSPEKFAYLGLKTVQDVSPGRGPLVGIYSSLLKAANPYLFAIACDMPFVNPELINYMKELCKDYDIVVPETEQGLEPLHAIYSKTCLLVMEKYINGSTPGPTAEGNVSHREKQGQRGKGRVIEFFSEVKVRTISLEEISKIPGAREAFLNFNTPEEYQKALKFLEPREN